MRLTRLPDGTVLLEMRWSAFVEEWRAAPLADRAVLPDRRPAVRRVRDDGEVTLLTPAEEVWRHVRPRLKALRERTPKRERRCGTCSATLTLAREYVWCWTFVCPVCQSREVWGKDHVGGTVGAGEREPDDKVAS